MWAAFDLPRCSARALILYVLYKMDPKGQVDLNAEAADDMGAPSGNPAKILYRPVATLGKGQREWGDKSAAPLAFLDKPAVAPPPSQIEPDEPLPSFLTFVRPSEPGAMEHRVDESAARVPKWMRRPSDREGGSRPPIDLEASPFEDADRGASTALSGFAGFQGDAETPPAEWGESGGAGFVEKLDPPGSLSRWLPPPERPKSAPGGQSGVGIEGTSPAVGKEGGPSDRANLASAVDSRLERQRAIADARRQKVSASSIISLKLALDGPDRGMPIWFAKWTYSATNRMGRITLFGC
jgi:hypothetical protein